jgi:2-polyprenyl-3-methyl-5-hydroxy-6-metoxy-1,4-benzoquinol methylase
MEKIDDFSEYPDIKKYSDLEGIPIPTLAEAFVIENKYHDLLLKEEKIERRQELYSEFYQKVIPVYGRDSAPVPLNNPKDKYVQLFKKELEGKTIIDYGCGQGYMLQSISKNLSTKKLLGIDVVIPKELKNLKNINFEEANLLTYRPKESFDIALSDNVIEHLVLEDATLHLKNIYQSLNKGGKLILIIPNKLFGPSDITRIKDFSHSGKMLPKGGHVNETTYCETIELLESIGFVKFTSVLPIPKLKYSIFKNIRVGTGWIKRIENSQFLLGMFRKFKINGVCPIRFTVTLIATKG